MKIKYIDGHRLSRAIVAGAKRVFQRTDYLNKINFFPVPDADTGSNISSTFQSIVNELYKEKTRCVKNTTKVAANAALIGAHGNSGVIFAQFFYGLYNEMDDCNVLTTEKFGAAAKRSVHYVYEALSEPKDGTIISVIRDWAEGVYSHSKKKRDFVELWEYGMIVAKKSLEKTRERIESKAIEVVDAGAQGFVDFLEGIYKFISKGRIKDLTQEIAQIPDFSADIDDHTAESLKDIDYRYCTEFLIKGASLETNQLRARLHGLGDSIVAAGSKSISRVHIHTDRPDKVMEKISRQSTEIVEQKVDDMKTQYIDSNTSHSKIALVADTACNLPQNIIDKYNIHIIPFNVIFGNEKFLDTLTISQDQFYVKMKKKGARAKTSQPSPGYFKKMYKSLLNHYETVISIHLAKPVSGAFQAAQNSASEFGDKVQVIDSKNITIGEGLLVKRVAQMISDGKSFDDIINTIPEIRENIQLFVSVPDVDTLMRSGRVSKAKGVLAKLFKIKPIITLDKNGVPIRSDKAFTKAGLKKKLLDFMNNYLKDKKNPEFMVAHVDTPETAQYYADFIKKNYYQNEVEIVHGSPVLASHTGLGTAAIGVSWEDEC
ncbi:MAG: DegV family EDD domain-containing protein [Candidatus Marinimicrobia bacterium]|nr:DegV family EDD domain-containing protein [Candidatus Neomarinimicrobiota bacterium]